MHFSLSLFCLVSSKQLLQGALGDFQCLILHPTLSSTRMVVGDIMSGMTFVKHVKGMSAISVQKIFI